MITLELGELEVSHPIGSSGRLSNLGSGDGGKRSCSQKFIARQDGSGSYERRESSNLAFAVKKSGLEMGKR
jgi:hypothetical protein